MQGRNGHTRDFVCEVVVGFSLIVSFWIGALWVCGSWGTEAMCKLDRYDVYVEVRLLFINRSDKWVSWKVTAGNDNEASWMMTR